MCIKCKCVCCFLIQFLVASLGLAGCRALGCHFDYEFKVFSFVSVRVILFSMASVILPALAVSLYTVIFCQMSFF